MIVSFQPYRECSGCRIIKRNIALLFFFFDFYVWPTYNIKEISNIARNKYAEQVESHPVLKKKCDCKFREWTVKMYLLRYRNTNDIFICHRDEINKLHLLLSIYPVVISLGKTSSNFPQSFRFKLQMFQLKILLPEPYLCWTYKYTKAYPVFLQLWEIISKFKIKNKTNKYIIILSAGKRSLY